MMPIILFCIILFLAPLFPDIKLARPKLLLLEIGLYGVIFSWLITRFYRSSLLLRRSLVALPLLIYAAIEIIFYYISPDKPVAVSELNRCLISCAAYLAAAHVVSSHKERSWLIYCWMGGSFLAIVYGILQHSGGFWRVQVPMMDRVMSTFGNPIFFAAHIAATIPIAAGLFLSEKRKSLKLFTAALITCSVLALYYTRTRAAFIAFAVSILIFFMLSVDSKKTKIILLSALAVAAAVFAILTKDLWLRQQAHLLIWRDTLVMWYHHPFIGTGPGTFHLYFPQYASDQLRAVWPQGQFIVNEAHNEYIQYLAETGVAGFGIFLWMITAFISNALRIYKETQGKSRFVVAGLISSAGAVLTQNFFSVDMRFIISAVYLFIVMGLIDSYNQNTVTYEKIPKPVRFGAITAVIMLAVFSYPKILTPYLAQKKVAATPDFFSERVLEPAKTIEDLEALIKKYPDQSLIYEKIGWVYSKERNWPKAIESYTKAAELEPRKSGPANNLGNIYFLNGNRQKAIEYWKLSLSIDPNQTDSRLNLATAYYYNGQLKEASDELNKVLQKSSGNQKAITLLEQMHQ